MLGVYDLLASRPRYALGIDIAGSIFRRGIDSVNLPLDIHISACSLGLIGVSVYSRSVIVLASLLYCSDEDIMQYKQLACQGV